MPYTCSRYTNVHSHLTIVLQATDERTVVLCSSFRPKLAPLGPIRRLLPRRPILSLAEATPQEPAGEQN